MTDRSDDTANVPVFLATGISYGANLAALFLLAKRFVNGGEADGAFAWLFIAGSCTAAALVCVIILLVRGKRRSGFKVPAGRIRLKPKSRARWNSRCA
ncbi:MAG: hypothetical protein A2Z99_00250 [Treponema sp. GWB1_62_6]|nr:MAG: hypothetical protein A2Z99_00250 [Treponema sp. GWB1_62_6]HCM28946.1 hypothetical protein [Treponema sp.]